MRNALTDLIDGRFPALRPATPVTTLWVLDHYLGPLVLPQPLRPPVALFNRKGDFSDEELLQACITAYTAPGSEPEDLACWIHAALSGQRWCFRARLPEPWRRLTPHLRIVARCLCAHETEEAIASYLFLSRNAVHSCVQRLYDQLGVHNRRELYDVMHAWESGSVRA